MKWVAGENEEPQWEPQETKANYDVLYNVILKNALQPGDSLRLGTLVFNTLIDGYEQPRRNELEMHIKNTGNDYRPMFVARSAQENGTTEETHISLLPLAPGISETDMLTKGMQVQLVTQFNGEELYAFIVMNEQDLQPDESLLIQNSIFETMGTVDPEPLSTLGGMHTTAFQIEHLQYRLTSDYNTIDEYWPLSDNQELSSESGNFMSLVATINPWEASLFPQRLALYTYNRNTGDKRYELSNHLGNVLSVVSDKKIPTLAGSSLQYFNPDIKAYNDYYPFGMLLPGRHANTSEYLYGFQGQEMDDEIKGEGNSVNYTFRLHDPRVGRFFATDPLEAKYPWYSSYQFSGNRPIDMIEFEGLEPTKPELFWNRLNKSEIKKIFGQDLERTVVFKTIGLHKLENNKLKGDEMFVARTYSEAETNNYYYDKYQKEWIPFNNISCLSCDLEVMGQQMIDAGVKYGAPTLMIVSGVVAVAAAIPTGGGSLAGWGAVYGTASLIGGTYSVAAGTAILTLEFKGDSEAAKKVPASYYDATVSIMFERAKNGENDKMIDVINGTISLSSNVMSIKLPQNSIQELDRAASIIKVLIDGVDYTKDVKNLFEEMKSRNEE